MRALSHPKKRSLRQGFSLVEVALAMGVVGFGLLSLVGMLPFGLTTFKQAMSNTVESQIVQNLSNDIVLANYTSLSSYAAPTWYYNYQGESLGSSSTGTVPAGAVYSASVTLASVSGSNSPAAFNSTTSASSVTIQITSLFDRSAYAAQHPHQYSVIVANNGR